MTRRANGPNDLGLINGMTLAVGHRSDEDTYEAQLNVADMCKQLWPGEAEEATKEILQLLGLHGCAGEACSCRKTSPGD
jgi:hypothetical protein